jgi:hypothetical protein
MGTWGYGIFEDDVTSDIKGDFEDYLDEGLTIDEATERILEEYEEFIEEDDDVGPTVYLALAYLQMEYDSLDNNIKIKALEIIENGLGLEVWEDAGESELEERKKVLNELKIKLMR